MDLKTLILGAVLIAVSVFPIVLISRSGKKARKNLIQSLYRIAKNNNCEINENEFCGDFIIGIDESKNYVFFYKKTNDKTVEKVIKLADFQSCQVDKKKRALKSNNVNFLEVESIELVFTPLSKINERVELEVYNIDSGRQLSKEIPIIEKWSEKLNKILKNNYKK